MFLKLLPFFDWTLPVTAVIVFVTYLFVIQWFRGRNLPPGPRPLPVIGNLLYFRGKESLELTLMPKWRKKYGDVFTLWVGPDPAIVVCGWDRVREGLITMKNVFSGRKVRHTNELFLDGHYDVASSDFGPRFETLRKLITMAIRKYSVSEKLPVLVNDVLKEVINLMMKEKGAFSPKDYTCLTVYNIQASTAFGKRYSMDDKEFLALKDINDKVSSEIGFGTILDVFPMLKYILNRMESNLKSMVRDFKRPIQNAFKEHMATYEKGTIRDFTDACIAAKQEAELENKETIEHLTDENMVLVIADLFSAGTDTTTMTLSWIMLYVSNFPEVQEKMRKEILENIGDQVPVQEDRRKCPYTQAVIAETLRIRPIGTFTLEHKSTCETDFAGYKIPKDCSILFHIFSQHMDPAHWKDPEAYRPERFMEVDGTFMSTNRFIGYLPFGLGRRGCPGEKLALTDLFLILTGLVQKCRFSLPGGPGSADLTPQNVMVLTLPKPYKIKVDRV